MSKIINCSFVMDISEFSSIDFYFGENIDGIEEDYDITKHYPTVGELTHGDIQLELSSEEFEALSENFFIEAKLNMTNDEGSVKAFTHKIKKEQALLGASLVVDSNTSTTVTFYLGEDSILKYDYNQSFNKPSVNNKVLEGNKNSVDLGIEQDNWYYVDDYIANNTVPTKRDMIFIGWFTDETLTEAYKLDTGLAYAGFASKDVFTVKMQQSLNGSIKFLYCFTEEMVNSLQTAGVVISGVYGSSKSSEKQRTFSKLYRTITVDGVSGITPQDLGYPEEATFFGVYTLTGFDFTKQPFVFNAYPILVFDNETEFSYSLPELFTIIKYDENGNAEALPQRLDKFILSQYPPAEIVAE